MFHVKCFYCDTSVTMRLAYTPNTICRRDKAKLHFNPGTLYFANRTAHTKVKYQKVSRGTLKL